MKKEIKSTKDYSIFKKLIGNRNITDARVNKIIKSINKVGYIPNPIIVNENMEIIDGQGRLEALKRLGLEVEYIVVESTGINECISMNLNQTNWNLMNYIVSYASRKNENYIKLLKLLQEYNDFNLNALATALFGISRFYTPIITGGELILSDDIIESAKNRMDYVRELNESIAKLEVNKSVLRQGLLFMTMFEEVDKTSFLEQFKRNSSLLKAFHTLKDCMHSLEELYNYSRKNRLYIYTMYDKLARENERRGMSRIMEKYKRESEEKEIKSKEELKESLESVINE